MADIKFGRAQLSNPTPSGVNFWVRVFTAAGAIFLAWMATANVMGPNTKDILTQILGLALALANGIAPLFGVEVNSKSVPAEDVTAIDNN